MKNSRHGSLFQDLREPHHSFARNCSLASECAGRLIFSRPNPLLSIQTWAMLPLVYHIIQDETKLAHNPLGYHPCRRQSCSRDCRFSLDLGWEDCLALSLQPRTHEVSEKTQ
jgi:hypothetical protein